MLSLIYFNYSVTWSYFGTTIVFSISNFHTTEKGGKLLPGYLVRI